MSHPYFSLLKTSWKYAHRERPKFVKIYLLFALSNIILACNPLLYGWFIDQLQRKGINGLAIAGWYAAAFVGLKLLEWMFHGPARVMERKLAFRISRNFLDDYYFKIVHLPMAWHQDHHTGATISKLRKGYESLKDFFQNGFVYLYAIGKFIFSLGAILYFSPLFGSIAVGLGIFTTLIIISFDKPYVKSLKEMNRKENEVSSSLFDSLSNIVTVVTLRLEKQMQHKVMTKVIKVFHPFKQNVVVNEWKWFTAQMLVALIYAVVVVGYIYQHWQPGEVFLIGGLITLIGFVNQFTGVFNDIAAQYAKVLQYNADVQMAIEIGLNYQQHKASKNASALPVHWNELEVNHLSFCRNNGTGKNDAAIREVSIALKRGKRIALIGESGSGKSTLLSLLRGLHAPGEQVEVIVDHQTLVPFAAVGDTVTLFPQEPEIFENTILYNITLGLPCSDEELQSACGLAQFTEVVNKLPKGLHTHIHEKGVNLSGGQKQRLALARGIIAARHSGIVLLDEPTSSVDPRTEKMIYTRMFEGFSDKAIISTLHRLHLLPMFDYIYLMKNGQIEDEGTFDDLLLRSPSFQELWEYQAEGANASNLSWKN